jgi:hypothetical protein
MARSGVVVLPGTTPRYKGIDATNAAIVAAALRSDATHVVTGDKRLLAEIRQADVGPLAAVPPREILDLSLRRPAAFRSAGLQSPTAL